MASEAQLVANRRNARKSTGPKTPEGKKASSGNAVAHGLSAKTVVLTGENAEDFASLRRRLFTEVSPDGPVENALVEKLACDFWRLRRVPAFEAAMMDWIAFREARAGNRHNEDPSPAPGQGVSPSFARAAERKRYASGRAMEAMLLKGDLLSKLARHEAHIARQIKQTLDLMWSLKKNPMKERISVVWSEEEMDRQWQAGLVPGL